MMTASRHVNDKTDGFPLKVGIGANNPSCQGLPPSIVPLEQQFLQVLEIDIFCFGQKLHSGENQSSVTMPTDFRVFTRGS